MPEFPELILERVNVREQPQALLDRGVSRYPAIACGERVLSKIFMTRRRIRKFLATIDDA